MTNAQIADQFTLLSKLMDIQGANAFKAKTYAIAAFHIEKIDAPLINMAEKDIAAIKGIGESAAKKITEMRDNVTFEALQDIIADTPAGVIELLKIKGLGPKKIHTIWKEMGIASIGELEYACMENRLTRYKGFGPKTQENVLESIKFYNQHLGHYLYAQVDSVYPVIKNYLEKLFGANKVVVSGAYRRQLPVMDALTFIIDEPLAAIKPKFVTAHPPEILAESGNHILYQLTNGLKLRLHAAPGRLYHEQFITSASDIFLEKFFEKYNRNDFDTLQATNEDAIFHAAGLPSIPPYRRESASILDNYNNETVIQTADIKGMVHNHSTWSDGVHTIEEMAKHLQGAGYEYLVISDHSRTATYANGLPEEKLLQQIADIDALNAAMAPFKIYKSIESDILNDGSLDYEDSTLQKLDMVIASVHSNLTMSESKAMERLLRAIENPYTTILGHPTGRLLLSRKGYPIDHKTIIDACIKNNVVIELNANPRRLDIDWEWISYIIENGGTISINPDAHSTEGFADVHFGIMAAQKAGVQKHQNLSSFSRSEMDVFLAARKKLKAL